MNGDPIQRVFAEIIGKPAWQVKGGYAGNLTFEFGDPQLEIREPRQASAESERVRELLSRRRVTVRGAWHLWIHTCSWKVIENGIEAAHSEQGEKEIADAALMLDGQVLLAVEVDRTTAACRFTFDLGAVLETSPYRDGPTDEQWLLYRPDGTVLTLRADRTWAVSPDDQGANEERWRPL